MTRRRVSAVLLAILLAALGYLVWGRLHLRMGGSPAPLETAFEDEAHWLVERMTRDVAQMALAAGGAQLDGLEVELARAESGWSARVELPSRAVSLEWTIAPAPYLWAPAPWAELAGAVMPGLAERAGLREGETLVRLLEPTAAVLVEEDGKLSEALAANGADPVAHERAALLLASLGLRESAGAFSDLRPTLSRVSAHLALAMTLRSGGDLGPEGRVALSILHALAGREVDAKRALEGVDAPAWRRALRMRLSEDWRVLRDPSGASLLERLEWLRAMLRTLSTPNAMNRYRNAFPGEDFPLEAYRLLVASYEGPSDGYYFRSDLLERELAAVRGVRRRYGETLRALDLALDDVPLGFHAARDGESPAVIGWPGWAAYFQRHLCEHLFTADTYFRYDLGLPDWADAYRTRADPHLARMTLHPFVAMRRTARRGVQVEDIEAMGGVVSATAKAPERVNASNWYFAAFTTRQMALSRGMPRGEAWFSPALAVETAFDTASRLRLLGRHRAPLEIGLLREIAPGNAAVWRYYLDLPRPDPLSLEEVTEALGPRTEYDSKALRVLWEVAADRGQETVPFIEKTCELEPDYCIRLGGRLLDLEREDEAAVAYRRAYDFAADRVYVANSMRWLVGYYEQHGRADEALEVARDAADTYSHRGLKTLGVLLESRGEIEEAEQWFVAAVDRYENPSGLIGFYYRLVHERGLSEYEPKLVEALRERFPNGLEPFDPAAVPTPPEDGVLIDSTSWALRHAGLASGDVILALDGWRVRDFDQYEVVRELTDSPDMKLVVWRVNALHDVEARVRTRRFGVDLRTYERRTSIDARSEG